MGIAIEDRSHSRLIYTAEEDMIFARPDQASFILDLRIDDLEEYIHAEWL